MSRACLISAFVEGFSSTHSLSTFIAHKQLGKFPSLLVWQLLECPRQWTPTLHTPPFAYLQEVQRKLSTVTCLPAEWTTFKERS
ncbi:hypothetical protein AVEN_242176-1 [Araneus ventricosus]|uniref:Uncharacterized protein n=1 Tax=Araneus ventricosus TaxID=182803 RepID=A0A4Y2DGI5_ARAVE|nr:hypothetical protein AVEN_242176-1 [Araneus ventricosus]